MISSFLPTLTWPPKPPVANGHRNATKLAAANVSRPTLVSVTVARLRNCRRLTPMASGSGGTHTDGRHRLGLDQIGAARSATAAALDVAPVWRDRQVDLGVRPSRRPVSPAERAGAAAHRRDGPR